jgi:putative transposase
MDFKPNAIYHIYNQGNNRQQIFFSEENYLFFIKKMRTYLLPYGDLLCYCLMPNHFHWLFYVREVILPVIVVGGAARGGCGGGGCGAPAAPPTTNIAP